MEYYLAIKRNKIGSFVVMWMNLEAVVQSEVMSLDIRTLGATPSLWVQVPLW